MKSTIKMGIIGGGLMGREAASACARWFVLKDFQADLKLTAVCDLNPDVLEWYKQIDTVDQLTTDYKELLNNPDVDFVYVAVPHNLHEQIYSDVLEAGKDLFAEKPFGIDLNAAEKIAAKVNDSAQFVRCSSEFPFMPGVQRLMKDVQSGALGQIMEVRAGFLHASDLNPEKAINWKRQVKTCGEIGVMGDLGMHVAHVPLRMGWQPSSVYAQLQNITKERPDGKGGTAACDTWDNARLHTNISLDGETVPMTWETKRMAPTETNTWYLEVYGTKACVKYSTKEPKTYWWCHMDGGEQWWCKLDLGFQSVFPTITGGIFEVGFPDLFLQMLAAYVAEREGFLDDRFGCATVEEAVYSQRVFDAALKSHSKQSVADL